MESIKNKFPRMKHMGYHFDCIYMKAGWCLETDAPGCFYDCEMKTCNHCRNINIAKKKELCDKCWIKNEKQRRDK